MAGGVANVNMSRTPCPAMLHGACSLHPPASALAKLMTQHSTQKADVRCFCILCVLQQTFPDDQIDSWCLICPMTSSPNPATSRPCQECKPHLPSASLGAPSQPANKRQHTIYHFEFTAEMLHSVKMVCIRQRRGCIVHCMLQNNVCIRTLMCFTRPVKLLGKVVTIRELIADVGGMHLCRVHMRRSPCAELLKHVGSHELPVPTLLHSLAHRLRHAGPQAASQRCSGQG